MKTNVVIGAVLCFAVMCQAQWTSQLLNDIAVTDGGGQMIVLSDNGGAYQNNGMTADKAFDLTTANTFYDAANATGAWAGFELQSAKHITRVRYTGRENWGGRMTGTLIQGANQSDFSDAVTLCTLAPPAGWNPTALRDETILSLDVTNSFTFVRFYCPQPNAYGGNFSRVEFYGYDAQPAGTLPPAAPSLTFSGCINWRMNICWTIDSSVMMYEIERKIAHEDSFTPHALFYATPGDYSQGHYLDTMLLYQDTDYHIRAINSAGESAWVAVAGLPQNAATGQWIGTPGGHNNDASRSGDKIFDGNVHTFFDGPNDSGGNDLWSGLDLKREQVLTKIRYMPRRLSDSGRIQNAWFEIADNPGFQNATTIATVPVGNVNVNQISELPLTPPRTTRYARFCSPNGGWGNVAEVEFVLAPDTPPLPPSKPLITATDITNNTAVLSWQLGDVPTLVSSTIVYRATSPGGPYHPMTPDGIIGSAMTWTDTTLTPGIAYYYKIRALLNATPAPLESPLSDYTAHRPLARIERDWTDNTKLKLGMTTISTHPPFQPHLDVDTIFDGDLATFADISNRSPAIGVDLGQPYHIQSMRFAARSNQVGRLNNAELRGSNDPDYTNNFTRLATFAPNNTYEVLVTQQTDSTHAFQYIFIQRPDGNEFFGNINELELYGWDPAAADTVLHAPESVTLTLLTTGVRLDWQAGTQQDAYRIERSPDGTSNWTTLGNVPTGSTFTDTNPILQQRMFYRVLATRAATPTEEIAYSDPYPITAYTPANGTGLTAYYYTNYTLAYDPNETLAATLTDQPAPDWQLPGAQAIHPDIPDTINNLRITYHGNLIIPFDGTYTFHVTSDDGTALRLGDTFLINNWTGHSTLTETATLTLTAGPHPLRLDYFNGTGDKALKLEWSGAIERATIPTHQLTPLTLPPNENIFIQTAAWQGRTFGGNRLGTQTLNPDATITISFGNGDLSGNGERHHYLWQDTNHRDFSFEAKIDIDHDPQRGSGKAFLMIRNDIGGTSPFLAPTAIANGGFNVKQRTTPGANITDAITWTGPKINPCHLRITRTDDTYTFAYRDPSTPTWTTIHTHTDTTSTFNRHLYYGIGVTAPNDTTPRMFQDVTFSEIKLTRLNTATLILIK